MCKTETVSPLRQRMIEDMAARKLDPHTQRSHISSCKRFAAWLKRLPDTATAEEVRRFQLHLVESGASICNRNRIVTGVRFLFRVTLRRHDLAAEIWHMKEPQKLPPVLSPEEIKRILNMATSLKARAMLSLAYGCGLRASEVARLRACDIDSDQMIIRVVQSKGRKDRNAASFLRHPSARGRQGHPADPGVARTREVGHDGALHTRGDGTHRQGREPGRAPDHAAPQAGDAEPREAADAIAPSAMVRPS